MLKLLTPVGDGPSALEELVELADVPVLLVGPDLRVRAWNSAAVRELRFTRSEMVGAHCITGVRCLECINTCPLTKAPPRSAVVSLYRKDGTVGWYRRTGHVLRDITGAVVGILEILTPDPHHTGDRPHAMRFGGLTSRSMVMAAMLHHARRLARAPVSVVIRGETGSGKATLVRAMHETSDRADRPLHRVVCNPHREVDWAALFERHGQGTVLLQHIDTLSAEQQQALARSWPDGDGPRILSTTAASLESETRAGRFEPGLMFRCRGASIAVPPLRERPEDIIPLAMELVRPTTEKTGRRIRGFDGSATEILENHSWPGNVRELAATVIHAASLGRGTILGADEVRTAVHTEQGLRVAATQPDDAALRLRISWALKQTNGRVTEAATLLEMSRSTFWRLRKRLGG
ncbi:MAG: sigma 54-interacting transcriptional regulator [Alphaproteobacteria bacterium]|nr:sigma 54-interacting transcriptional regulator [Alphaproteobacteria bacterium]